MSIDSFEASRKRSDEIRADLPIHPEKYTMLTGDRPTGRLHMGHYFGTIRERVALQDMGITTRIIIADYQVITDQMCIRDRRTGGSVPKVGVSIRFWRAGEACPRKTDIV